MSTNYFNNSIRSNQSFLFLYKAAAKCFAVRINQHFDDFLDIALMFSRQSQELFLHFIHILKDFIHFLKGFISGRLSSFDIFFDIRIVLIHLQNKVFLVITALLERVYRLNLMRNHGFSNDLFIPLKAGFFHLLHVLLKLVLVENIEDVRLPNCESVHFLETAEDELAALVEDAVVVADDGFAAHALAEALQFVDFVPNAVFAVDDEDHFLHILQFGENNLVVFVFPRFKFAEERTDEFRLFLVLHDECVDVPSVFAFVENEIISE